MDIKIGDEPVDGKVHISIRYDEMIDDLGYSAQVDVWVPASDSISEIHERAYEEAKKFLQRALSAHSSLDHQ